MARDIINIYNYLQDILKSNQTKNNFLKKLNKELESIEILPHGSPEYFVGNEQLSDYRGVMVKKYILFYHIDEKNKVINIARIFYSKQNYVVLLEKF